MNDESKKDFYKMAAETSFLSVDIPEGFYNKDKNKSNEPPEREQKKGWRHFFIYLNERWVNRHPKKVAILAIIVFNTILVYILLLIQKFVPWLNFSSITY